MPSQIPGPRARLGDFLIQEQVGVGGMGVVFKAFQESLGRTVALKILGRALSDSQEIVRFQRESQAIAKLNHPAIATVYFVGQDQYVCYMAMEYVDGKSLFSVISSLQHSTEPKRQIDEIVNSSEIVVSISSRRFDIETEVFDSDIDETIQHVDTSSFVDIITQPTHVRRACEIVRDVAHGLQHAHDKNVIHRDIKPGNVMVTREGGVKLIDFGLARFLEDATVTRTGQLVGTPLYMSPEQVTGRITLDHRTDIYSLGLVLYELLRGDRKITSLTLVTTRNGGVIPFG